MRHTARVLTFLGVLTALAARAVTLLADPPEFRSPVAVAPRDRVLLLKNGQVLAGRITWSGDHYFVDRDGLQMGVRSGEVLATAADMDDAYRWQRARLARDDLEGHQTLAQWCLRHDLLGYAATELADCEALQPSHARTALLMRQLQSAVRTVENAKARRAPSEGPTDAGMAQTHSPPDDLPRDAVPRANSGAKAADVSATLSNESLETFVTTIQPLLINQCAAGGCHGGATKAELKFQRFDPRRSPSRVYTERNLAAVLKHIDHDTPEASPLVVVPSQPHGGMATPVFSGRTLGQRAELVAWVRGTVRPSGRVPQATRNTSGVVFGNDVKKPAKAPVARAVHEENASHVSKGRDGAAVAPDGAAVGGTVNSHDPDEFNRRFFPRGRAVSGDTDAPQASATPATEPEGSPQRPLPRSASSQRPRTLPGPGEGLPRAVRPPMPLKPKRGSVGEDEIPPFKSIEEG